jgi:predicted MFS family arabinose efflux permease
MMLAAGRINRRLILLALSVLLLASDLVSAIAPTFGVMLLGRALLGASLGGFWTVALAASGRLVPEHYAARASAMIFMGITLATLIGVPLGTFIASLASWRASFVATAILVAIALAAQAALLPSLPAAVAIRLSDLRALLARANPRKSLLVVALGFGAHFTAYTYIAPFLMGNASFSLPAITAVLLGFGLAGFVANFAVSTTVIRHLQKSLFSMLALLMLCLFALPLLHASHAGVTAAVTIWGVAYGAIPLCLSIWMQQSSPDLPEAGSALFVSTVQIAIALGSFGGGEVVDRIGIPATLQLGGALALVALVVIASFRARGARFEDLLAGR